MTTLPEFFFDYVRLGMFHVVPYGYDHILFIFLLYLTAVDFKSILLQCLVFTISHSFTLILGVMGIIIPNPEIIEPLIAFSIFFTAIENILMKPSRNNKLIFIFLFGLIHGLGFSFSLNEMEVSKSYFLVKLLSFNLGVEVGQILVILISFLAMGYWFKDKAWYQTRIVYPMSSLIGCIALFITLNRIFHIV